MSKVAITGGAGFLGSNLVRGLINRGDEVLIIDNLSSGSTENLRNFDINQKCIIGDLKSYEFAKESLRRVDTMYHFAAKVGSVAYLHGSNEAELDTMQENLVIDANVFRACIENQVKNVIFASSVSVYPFDDQLGASDIQFKEEDSEKKVNPEGGYGWSKYIGEKQLQLMTGVSFGIARIFHAYGENIYLREDKSQVIGSLIRKAIRFPAEDFTVWGDGNQRRCFVFVDDVINALFRIEDHVKKKGSVIVNIGTQEEVTIGKLAEIIAKLSGKQINIKFDESKPTGALNRKPDLEKIGRLLGWTPRTNLQDGLRRTYVWAMKRLGTATDVQLL
ncbi:MAG: NAD-dependent epimerase/dehydratase family protein [Nitrososphaerales archaeon]